MAFEKVGIELDLRCGDAGKKAALARYWFHSGLSMLAGSPRGQLNAQEQLPPENMPFSEGLIGGVTASLVLEAPGSRETWVYSQGVWDRFMCRLEETDFRRAAFVSDTIAGPWSVTTPYFELRVQAVPEDPTWLQFIAVVSRPDFDALDASENWADFAFRAAGELHPVFGHFVNDSEDLRTLHEERKAVFPFETIPRAQEKLRGFSWLTMLSPNIVSRLGSIDALSAPGVFYRVSELPNGGALLQATERRVDYTHEVRGKLQQLFEPVLV